MERLRTCSPGTYGLTTTQNFSFQRHVNRVHCRGVFIGVVSSSHGPARSPTAGLILSVQVKRERGRESMPNAVTSGKWSPNELRAMSVAVSLSSSLVFFPGCAARTAQQVIDSLKEQSIAMQGAVEFTRLERLKLNSKCRGAHDTFGRLISPPLEEEFRRSGPKFLILDFRRFSTTSNTPTSFRDTWGRERQPRKPPLLS